MFFMQTGCWVQNDLSHVSSKGNTMQQLGAAIQGIKGSMSHINSASHTFIPQKYSDLVLGNPNLELYIRLFG